MITTNSSLDTLQTEGRAYSRLVDDLLTQIQRGELADGDRIPPEIELRDSYEISTTSVRRGLRVLEDGGLLVRRQGSGSYVRTPKQVRLPRVERTAVTSLWATALQTYHPYFSELRKGVETALTRHGWSVWTPTMRTSSSPSDLAWNTLKKTEFQRQLQDHPEVAGAIMGGALAIDLLGTRQAHFPVVVDVANQDFPYVAYDWDDEVEQGLRCLLRAGCRRPAVLSVRTRLPVEDLIRRASLAVEPEAGVAARILPKPGRSCLLSHCIRESYTVMRQFLDDGTPFDGLLIDDDFYAQGALDALAEHGPSKTTTIPIVALLNKESRLQTGFAVTAVVADGNLHGQALASLWHDHLTNPDRAASSVILRGEIRRANASRH